jgi:hypothetical protein
MLMLMLPSQTRASNADAIYDHDTAPSATSRLSFAFHDTLFAFQSLFFLVVTGAPATCAATNSA